MSGKQPSRAEQFADSLKRNLAAELSDDALLCPRCGDGWVTPDGSAASRLGVCQPCYLKALAEANRLAVQEIQARREHDAARAAKSRAARKAKGR